VDKFKLAIELVPKTSWYANMRKVMSQQEWDILRRKVYTEYNHVCGACGVKFTLPTCIRHNPMLHYHQAGSREAKVIGRWVLDYLLSKLAGASTWVKLQRLLLSSLGYSISSLTASRRGSIQEVVAWGG